MAVSPTVKPSRHARVVLALAFLSGFAGLIYQVLWMKQLGLLFGNTAHAASATLSSFFAGLAVGSWFWGRRVSRSTNTLRVYALLEAGIALTALAYFVILSIFGAIYPITYQSIQSPPLMLALKFALALLLIFPPSFCMGGTIPVMGQYLVRHRSVFGRQAALLYGVNTLGAAVGVACTAFLLIPTLGFGLTCGLAILISLGVGGVAWRLSTQSPPLCGLQDETVASGIRQQAQQPARGEDAEAWRGGRLILGALCFVSGFGMLALEVLWTRMCAQVHSNSVYAFAIILIVVLTCLALGAGLSSQLARLNLPPLLTLGVLTTLGGIALAFGPTLYLHVTDNLRPLSSLAPWPQFVGDMFYKGFAGIGVIVLILGTIFPFLMKAQEHYADSPGQTLGRLMALNTLGAILGSLVCGFVFLPTLGMWHTMRLITGLYLVAGLLIPYGWGRTGIACRALGGIFLLSIFTVLDPSGLPRTGVDPRRPGNVLATWEGSDCTVTVWETVYSNRSIRVNSGYALGSTDAYREQVNQASVPLHLFPDTESIFFLGLGTGITAGGALDPQFTTVKRVVTCELVPEVVEAAKGYMPQRLTGGVFTDPRSTILIEDGRHYLMATKDTYDMINADLFLPYRQGAGSLYSLNHYRQARRRLNPGGVYVQWLPLFQLTETEFGIIARTMLEAFEQVTMWRNNFQPGKEIVALIGQDKATPIPPLPPDTRDEPLTTVSASYIPGVTPPPSLQLTRKTVPFLYCGNITAARALFDDYPVNTDDRPLIEYLAPRLFRRSANEPIIWFVGPKIAMMVDRILALCPPESDPMLRERSPANRRLVRAGAAFHCAGIWEVLGDEEARQKEWRVFVRAWNASAENDGPR